MDNLIVKTSQLFKDTLAEKLRGGSGKKIVDRFEEFLKTKKQNPLQPFGSNDKPFIKEGPLGRAIPNETLLHAHLTRDVSVVYSLSGKDPRILKLYGIFTHSDLGTGTPGNVRKQQSMADRLARVS